MKRTKIFVLPRNISKNNTDREARLPVLVAHVGDEKIEAKQLALRAPDGTIVGRLLYDRRHHPPVWIEWYGTVAVEDWEMET